MISIIIPVYNCEQSIDRCLASVLSQTYSDIEIIIIDDCSTDNSYKKCLSYQRSDNRVKVYRNDINQGVSYSRNRGIDKATGDYICFVDADDELYATNALELLYNPSYDLVCGNFELIRDNEVSIDNKLIWCTQTTSLNREEFLKQTYEYINCPRGTNNLYSDIWAKLHKTSIIKDNNIQFCPHMTKDEGVDFSLEYAIYTYNCLLLPNIIYKYNTTEKMAYHYRYEHGKGNMVLNMVSTFRKAEKLLDETGVEKNKKDKLLLNFMNYYLNRYLYFNDLLRCV